MENTASDYRQKYIGSLLRYDLLQWIRADKKEKNSELMFHEHIVTTSKKIHIGRGALTNCGKAIIPDVDVFYRALTPALLRDLHRAHSTRLCKRCFAKN